jgi:phage gpG-like protein
MADESLKTIKQKLTELNKLVKQGKELTAVQEQELRTLRAQKKELSERSKWQRKILDNQMSSVKQNENLAKLIELQKKKE